MSPTSTPKAESTATRSSLTVYDDAGNPNQTRIFGTRLIENDKVDALLAGTTTATALAIIPLAENARIPLINFAGAVQAVSPVKRYVFKTPHTDLMACEKIFQDLKQRGLTKIAMISGLDAFGKSMRDQCRTVTAKYGIEIVHEESYNPGDTDMTPQLGQHKSQSRSSGGNQSRLRPGAGDRHAQLPAARYQPAALSKPRCRLEAVYRPRRRRRRRRPSSGRGPACCRQAAGQRSAEEDTGRLQDHLRKDHRPAGVDLRRPRL